MDCVVKLYSNYDNEISRFLKSYFGSNASIIDNNSNNNDLEWEKKYQNPIEMVDIIGTFIENNDKFKINMWIGLDKHIFINVTDINVDKIIRYIYERYPW